jgi:hypothetical protein
MSLSQTLQGGSSCREGQESETLRDIGTATDAAIASVFALIGCAAYSGEPRAQHVGFL